MKNTTEKETTTDTPNTDVGRIPGLDGLRGYAISMVMAFHFFMTFPPDPKYFWFGTLTRSGWIGVDLFFVLSGFLITRVLLSAKDTKNRYWIFYIRRSLRIFPVYYGYLLLYFLLVAVFSVTMMNGGDIAMVKREFPWLLIYASNFLIAIQNNFLTPSLNHFWTLAIEEQYYLFWPMVVFFFSRKNLGFACVFCFCTAIIIRCLALLYFGWSSTAVHVLMPFRMDSFALGGFIAIAFLNLRQSRFLEKASIPIFLVGGVGIAIYISRMGYLNDNNVFIQTIGYSYLALFFGLLLLISVSAKPGSILYFVFNNSFAVFLGKYSYSLYVLHYPVHRSLAYLWPVNGLVFRVKSFIVAYMLQAFVAFVISLLLAWLSWYLFEIHFLKLKKHFNPVIKTL